MFDEGDMTDFQSATLGFSFTDDDYEDESFDDFDDDFYEEESFESLEEDDDIQEPFDDVEAEDGYDLSSHKPYDSGIDFEDF